MQKTYWVYIVASSPNGALYVGVTNDLARRIYEHKTGLMKGHTKRYNIKHLVWCASFHNIEDAIAYEKRIKKWPRIRKIALIEEDNKNWKDMYDLLNV